MRTHFTVRVYVPLSAQLLRGEDKGVAFIRAVWGQQLCPGEHLGIWAEASGNQ